MHAYTHILTYSHRYPNSNSHTFTRISLQSRSHTHFHSHPYSRTHTRSQVLLIRSLSRTYTYSYPCILACMSPTMLGFGKLSLSCAPDPPTRGDRLSRTFWTLRDATGWGGGGSPFLFPPFLKLPWATGKEVNMGQTHEEVGVPPLLSVLLIFI